MVVFVSGLCRGDIPDDSSDAFFDAVAGFVPGE